MTAIGTEARRAHTVSVTRQNDDELFVRHMPDTGCSVAASGNNVLVVRTETSIQNRLAMSLQHSYQASGSRVPQVRGVIFAGADDECPIGTESYLQISR
jgi:hypothetical protein